MPHLPIPDDVVQAALSGGFGGILTIDLGALAANYRQLQTLAAGEVGAVVKADAYGLGAGPVAQTLYDTGCRTFFVAMLCEGLALKPHLPADADLYVLNGLIAGQETVYADAGLFPVLNTADALTAWQAEAQRRQTVLRAAVQIDSGMSRLGFASDELAALAEDRARFEGVDVTCVMSHLAVADTPDHPGNLAQKTAFDRAAALFPKAKRSLANSAGLFMQRVKGVDYSLGLARPGISLYGGAALSGVPSPMQAVVALDLFVAQSRRIGAGTGIGYGHTVVTDTPHQLSILSGGYADGIARIIGPKGAVWYGKQRLPFIGRVSMDSIIVDATDLPHLPHPGETMELIGPHQSLQTLADMAGTIDYEILTSLGQRYYRHYLPAEGAAS